MNQVKTNGFAIEKISELVIGNLIVLLTGCLGYLTGFLKAILGNPAGQFNGASQGSPKKFINKKLFFKKFMFKIFFSD